MTKLLTQAYEEIARLPLERQDDLARRILWMAYFDASALIKRYAPETGTPLVNEVFRRVPLREIGCFVVSISEIVSILVRKRNDGRLSRDLFEQGMSDFAAEFISDPETWILPVDDHLVLSSLNLIARHNLNAVDTLILRSVLNFRRQLLAEVRELFFITSDKRLVRAMQMEGVVVVDSEVAPVGFLISSSAPPRPDAWVPG